MDAFSLTSNTAETVAAINAVSDVVPISKVEPRIGQPRTLFDEDALQDLADSISQHGILQPLTVRPLPGGYYQIIAGERRWRAARLAGLLRVPVRIIEADDRLAQELALVENLQREDLNPIEEAKGYKVLLDDYGLSQREVSVRVGCSRPAITNSLRLLSLPAEVLDMVERGELSSGHARAILPIPSAEMQIEVAHQVIDKDMTVRQVEAIAAKLSKEPDHKEPLPSPGIDYAAVAGDTLGQKLGRKVRIITSGKKGRIELEFYDADDRERLLDALNTLTLK